MAEQPVIIGTWSFAQPSVSRAIAALRDGLPSIDAVEAVCCEIEADETIDSVGYGGLPDRTGRVSLDACVMLAPNRCGSVCAVRRHLHVATIARQVMERTAHVMLAGEAADDFADAIGQAAKELLSPAAQSRFKQWQSDRMATGDAQSDALAPATERPMDRGHGALFGDSHGSGVVEGEDRSGHFDTIGVLALDRAGALAGACSTSGMPWKVAGRVGDSPIIGHGLYVDPEVGAVTATGHGELIMRVCGAFLAVERMRGGAGTLDALLDVLLRIRAQCDIGPRDQVALVAMRPDGETASAALRSGFKVVRGDEGEPVIADPDAVLLA